MRTYGVAALTREVDRLLGRTFPVVLVEGEVAQIQTPASGHAYFVLREGEACLGSVMWRSDWSRSSYRPRVGDRVLCRGRLGVYGAQGRYQLYVNVIRPAGEGDLQRELEQRKARLAADGLLDPRRKRPLPRWPRVIGVATSLTGAALQDFLRVSRERCPSARVVVAGCTVQGAEAPASVIRALELLYHHGGADVVVVTRGGGSKADLMAFNDEQLARWMAESPVPVVSAVGHEIDTTLADLVADVVAPTPSAAAVAVLPDARALAQRVDDAVFALQGAASRHLSRRGRELAQLRARLRHPGDRLRDATRRRQDLEARLRVAIARRIRERRRELGTAERALGALSPYAVLDRGYAIVTGPSGVVTRPDAVHVGDRLDVRVRGGGFGVEVVHRDTPGRTSPEGEGL